MECQRPKAFPQGPPPRSCSRFTQGAPPRTLCNQVASPVIVSHQASHAIIKRALPLQPVRSLLPPLLRLTTLPSQPLQPAVSSPPTEGQFIYAMNSGSFHLPVHYLWWVTHTRRFWQSLPHYLFKHLIKRRTSAVFSASISLVPFSAFIPWRPIFKTGAFYVCSQGLKVCGAVSIARCRKLIDPVLHHSLVCFCSTSSAASSHSLSCYLSASVVTSLPAPSTVVAASPLTVPISSSLLLSTSNR